METGFELLGKVVLDTGQADAALAGMQSEMAGATGAGTTGAKQMDISWSSAMGPLMGVTAAAGLMLGAFKSMGAEVDRIKGMFQEWVQAAMDVGQAEHYVMLQTGATAEEAGQLSYAAQVLGVSTEALATSMNFALHKGTDVSLEGMLRLSDTYTSIQNPIARTQWLLETFGRSGENLAPIMALGRTALKGLADEGVNLGYVMGGQVTAAVVQTGIDTEKLHLVWQGLTSHLGALFLPVIIAVKEVFIAWYGLLSKAAAGLEDVDYHIMRCIATLLQAKGITNDWTRAMLAGKDAVGETTYSVDASTAAVDSNAAAWKGMANAATEAAVAQADEMAAEMANLRAMQSAEQSLMTGFVQKQESDAKAIGSAIDQYLYHGTKQYQEALQQVDDQLGTNLVGEARHAQLLKDIAREEVLVAQGGADAAKAQAQLNTNMALLKSDNLSAAEDAALAAIDPINAVVKLLDPAKYHAIKVSFEAHIDPATPAQIVQGLFPNAIDPTHPTVPIDIDTKIAESKTAYFPVMDKELADGKSMLAWIIAPHVGETTIHVHYVYDDAEKHAGGGLLSGGLALVGEEGPELIAGNKGARVFTASQTQQVFNQQRDSHNNFMTGTNNFYVPSQTDAQALINLLRPLSSI